MGMYAGYFVLTILVVKLQSFMGDLVMSMFNKEDIIQQEGKYYVLERYSEEIQWGKSNNGSEMTK